MFIRKRKIKLKGGQFSEIYQAVKSYRSDGKVKQKVVALGKHQTVRDALDEIEMMLAMMEINLRVPLSKYRVRIRWAKKHRSKLENNYEKLKEKHLKLLDIEQSQTLMTSHLVNSKEKREL